MTAIVQTQAGPSDFVSGPFVIGGTVTTIGPNVVVGGTPVTQGTFANVSNTQNNLGNASGNNIVNPTDSVDPGAMPDVKELMKGKSLWLSYISTVGNVVPFNQSGGLTDSEPVLIIRGSIRVASNYMVGVLDSIFFGWAYTFNNSVNTALWQPKHKDDIAEINKVFAGKTDFIPWSLISYTGTAAAAIIKAKGATATTYTDIGLTRKDADVLWLLNEGIISRKQVANWAPLLDSILYDPYNPDRDATAAGTGASGSTASTVDTGNNYKGEPAKPTMAESLKVPLTAAMLVGLGTLASKLGGEDKIIASPIIPALNSGNYAQGIGLVNTLKDKAGKPIAGKEAIIAQLGKDGVPSNDGSVTETLYNEVARPYINPTITPGFSDPTGKYPSIVEESSTNRLARNQSITRTIIAKKEAGRVTDVRTANGYEWSQPKQPYNAKYPYNQVRSTESGHVQEFDDSPGNERIHTYHRSGTYEEIDASGTRVNRIVGDDFEILERNGHVLIKGSCNVTIIGNQNIRVEQDANIEVKGDARLKVAGDVRQGINGTVYQDILGNVLSKVAGNVVSNITGNMQSKVGGNTIINSSGDIGMSTSGSMNVSCSGNFNVQASKINLNPGSVSVGSAGVAPEQTKFPVGTKKVDMPTFSELKGPTRNSETLANYESPDEGSPGKFKEAITSSGIDKGSKADDAMKDKKTEAGKTTSGSPKTIEKTDIESCSKFTKDFPLSPNFSLGKLTSSPCGGPVDDPGIVENLRALAVNCLEPIYKRYPNMIITSGYRKSVPEGGSKTSDHLTGCAADIMMSGFSRTDMYEAVIEISGMLPAYTQLLLEYSKTSCWIHVSYNAAKGAKKDQFTMNQHARVSDFGQYKLIA